MMRKIPSRAKIENITADYLFKPQRKIYTNAHRDNVEYPDTEKYFRHRDAAGL